MRRILLPITILLAGCAADASDSSTATTDPLTVHSDDQGITVERSLTEVLDSEKGEAVDSAFKIVTDRLATAYPDSDVPAGAAATREHVDFGALFTQGQTSLQANLTKLADYGVPWTDVVPSGFFFVAGGKFTANLHIGGGGSVDVVFVVLPKKISRITRGNPTVQSFWRFKVGIAFMGLGDVGVGEGGGATARFGAGLIWGAMEDPAQFKGLVSGVSTSFALGVGNDFKVLLMKRDTSAVINNVLFMGQWQAGGAVGADFHGTVGLAVPLQGMLDQLGLAAGPVDSPTKTESHP